MLFHHKNPGNRHFTKTKNKKLEKENKDMTAVGVRTSQPYFKNKINKTKKFLLDIQFNIKVLEYHLLKRPEKSFVNLEISVIENIEEQILYLNNNLASLKSNLLEKKRLETNPEKHLHISGIHCEEQVDKKKVSTQLKGKEELEGGEITEKE